MGRGGGTNWPGREYAPQVSLRTERGKSPKCKLLRLAQRMHDFTVPLGEWVGSSRGKARGIMCGGGNKPQSGGRGKGG